MEEQARSWMKRALRNRFEDFDDCGEVNCTKLAEECADELDLCEGEEAEIPEWMFELSFEVSEKFKR